MKITKDILNVLNISSMYILKEGGIHICIPVDIEGSVWKISTDTPELTGNAVIKTKYNGNDYLFKVHIDELLKSENFSFTYKTHLVDSTEKNLFMLEYSILEKKLKNWDKRKEERYEIGFDENKIAMFSLKSFEQKVIVNKLTLPCMINDISFGGTKLTTIDSNFSREKNIIVYFSFLNPIEQILIEAEIRNLSLKQLEGQIAATLSLEFKDAPVRYKQRVADFIAKQKKLAQSGAN